MSNMSREEFINWMVQNIGEWPTDISKTIRLPDGYGWRNHSCENGSEYDIVGSTQDRGVITRADWRFHIMKISSPPEDTHAMSRSEFFDWMAQNISTWPKDESTIPPLPDGYSWMVTTHPLNVSSMVIFPYVDVLVPIEESDWLTHRGELVSRYNKSAERKAKQFRADLISLINNNSMENESDTPDFIIADFLIEALSGYNRSVNQRSKWYRKPAEKS